jgi:hypothetical protein
MTRKFFIIITVFINSFLIYAQVEKPPVYKGCETDSTLTAKKCFIENVTTDFIKNYQKDTTANTPFSVLFTATKEGNFEVVYIKTDNPEIKQKVRAAFAKLPKFTPASFSQHPIDQQFILTYPITENNPEIPLTNGNKRDKSINNPLYQSTLRVSFSHQNYRSLKAFDTNLNTHTAVKPYNFNIVSKEIDFDSIQEVLTIDKTTWLGRKFWNENMLDVQDGTYWFHLDPIADLQLGKDNSDNNYTYNNTRAIRVEGGLGKKIGFSSTLFESQGRFASYFNKYARAIKPSTDGYAVVPGRDISKGYKDNGFDYPLTTGYLSIQATDQINVQFGHDRNFIGEGYRSLFLSDVGAPYTFLKFNTQFWKIQYTNIWTWLRDVNTLPEENEPYKRKYMALHYLSWNATKKLNIGLFESVIWSKTEDRGFDVQYLNPVIFYRALEFSNGSKSGNAMLGLSLNYKLNDNIKCYSQFILDELTMSEFVKKDGYWANKYGIQLGVKYYDAFKIPNLYLQAEYNQVRPYTYSHSKPEINYGHVNQSLAHLWGSNFKELTLIANYQKNRWFGHAKLTTGIKGFDYNTDDDSYSYGGDIFKPYTDRNGNYGIEIGQGNKANIFIGELKAGYILNPATNLKLFGSFLTRDFQTPAPDSIFENKTTTWITIGFRTDINNWYFDF